jgi:hypothetical protein
MKKRDEITSSAALSIWRTLPDDAEATLQKRRRIDSDPTIYLVRGASTRSVRIACRQGEKQATAALIR